MIQRILVSTSRKSTNATISACGEEGSVVGVGELDDFRKILNSATAGLDDGDEMKIIRVEDEKLARASGRSDEKEG